jgi:hypothetical protein
LGGKENALVPLVLAAVAPALVSGLWALASV